MKRYISVWSFLAVLFVQSIALGKDTLLATARIEGSSEGDFSFSQISVGDKYAILRTGSLESTHYLYEVMRTPTGFQLKPKKVDDPNWGLSPSPIQIDVQNPSQAGSLVEILSRQNQAVVIHGSPTGGDRLYRASGFHRESQDLAYVLGEKPLPEPPVVAVEPPPKLPGIPFVAAKIDGSGEGDLEFSEIALNDQHAILSSGTLETSQFFYEVTRLPRGLLLRPLEVADPNWKMGPELQIDFKNPGRQGSVVDLLSQPGQKITIHGSPEGGERDYSASVFQRVEMPLPPQKDLGNPWACNFSGLE